MTSKITSVIYYDDSAYTTYRSEVYRHNQGPVGGLVDRIHNDKDITLRYAAHLFSINGSGYAQVYAKKSLKTETDAIAWVDYHLQYPEFMLLKYDGEILYDL